MPVKEELTIAEKLLTDVAVKYPHIKKDNTEAVIYCIEEVAHRKGFDIAYDEIWMEVKTIMRTRGYKPTTIDRATRNVFKSTPEQRDKEVDYHLEYGSNNPSKG